MRPSVFRCVIQRPGGRIVAPLYEQRPPARRVDVDAEFYRWGVILVHRPGKILLNVLRFVIQDGSKLAIGQGHCDYLPLRSPALAERAAHRPSDRQALPFFHENTAPSLIEYQRGRQGQTDFGLV